MSVIVIVVLGQVVLFSASVSGWTYSDQEDWPSSCRGSFQSPIPLSFHSIHDYHFGDIDFDAGTYEPKTATVRNTGHTVEVRFTNDTQRPTISGGGLEGEYVLENFHFHWPAEHTINGHRYPLEGHFVYYSTEYENFETALENEDGIAVLAVFYRLSSRSNSGFRFVKDVASVARTIGQPVPLRHPISLVNLFPLFTNRFYRYDGSLTTPNCDEVVVWTVFASPGFISSDQLQHLVNILGEDGNPLQTNNRKLQEVNDRDVLFNYI